MVNVGSISGLLATPMTGLYVTSKFALEGMNGVLRRELHQQGIGVVTVEPGGIKTPLMYKTTQTSSRSTVMGRRKLRCATAQCSGLRSHTPPGLSGTPAWNPVRSRRSLARR
ncbi:SDR family NAD(P)-dependent oxidoreductase [Mycolicibacterium arabiense]|uniref:SDR family NAD(P)-dependent oxidoreductase n=1 Tax=Mycolicibacterium arabiense TaxID=1286181 RepID=UPI0038994C93